MQYEVPSSFPLILLAALFLFRQACNCVVDTEADGAGCPSFDPASLAILERLGQLEELIRVKSGDESPDRSRLDDELLLDEKPTLPPREYREFSTVTIETVLAWPVFRNKFALRLDLKSLLKQKDAAPPAASLHSPASDNWHSVNVVELGMCNRLLDSFLHRVHIANPILDVPAVRGYVRHACLNGLGRDAQSCLVVSRYVFFYSLLCLLISPASA